MTEPQAGPGWTRQAPRDLSRLVRASADATPSGWIRLSANEFAFPPSPGVRDAVAHAAETLNRYPNPLAEPLRSQIAEHHDVAADRVLVSHGADGVLAACFRAFCEPGSCVALMDPTYPFLYNLAEMAAARVVLAGTAEAALENSRACAARLTVLVNPNNPTGAWLEPARILADVPPGGVVVLDEAYASFAPRSAIERMGETPDVLVVRSFSKSYGLAGVRLGYAVGSESLITRLTAVQDPYPVSSMAIAAGAAALRDPVYYARCVETVRFERERLASGLRDLGWGVGQSHANFVFGEPPPGSLARSLALLDRERVHVRTFARAAHGLRVSVGLPDENTAVLRALAC